MAGQNQQQFEEYFRRADLDRDGRISGAEAVAFFQGSGLSKQVLAQIWTHADQSHTGYLGQAEFYNALKLVTVAQSKRELTADIVKAALYGPASSKIPPPQINIAASPPPQLSSVNTVPVPQMGAVGPTPSQSFGFRGQTPQSPSMNQQFFPPQGNQSVRLPAPMSTSSASRPPLGVAGPDVSRTSGMVGRGVSNSNISNKWFSDGPSGVPAGSTSQTPGRGISPLLSPVAPKPQDLLSASSLMAAKDPNASTTSGNGLGSNSIFGGDMFSATQSLPNQTSSTPIDSAGSSPAYSAIVSTSITNQPNAKPDPFESLHSSFAQQSAGVRPQQTPSFTNSNQQVSVRNSSSVLSSGMPVQGGNSMPDQSQPPWPKMTRTGVQKYVKVFLEVDTDRDGRITGDQARNLFLSWRLPREVLRQVWNLSDQDNDSMLSLREFCIALYLMERFKDGRTLPETLPSSILLDETLSSVAGLPTAAYGTAGWGSTPGWRPQHGMPGAQAMTPTGLRPPMQPLYPQADGPMQSNQQKAREPSMEDSNTNRLSNGEQNALDSKSPETLEAEKKAEDKEKVILDSREKLEFYRSKMQDLVLYKSRCDNRLNEITERAFADKREAELLGKKYEEKYKQVAEMASKLTIEEASFRETQERKMELHQAIIKMEQGGSADGLLQVRADRIQSDLEELLGALTERCKKHGVNVKSAALIELPPGWQPGIPEESAVWDEEWDKFEDAGFSFDVALNSNTNPSALPNEISSPNANLSPDSLSNANGMSERSFKVDHASEIESAYTHSEDELMKSPTGSPARHAAFDSPSKDSSDGHFGKSFEETHRSFDEPTWGTFDNNEDADSVWGFGAKDYDHEKHGEKYFFGSPTKRDSPQADDVFRKKSPFFEDSVPSTPLSRAGNSPSRYSVSGDPFFDNLSRYDSFSMHDQRETLTRFDSVNSIRVFDHSRGFSFDDSDPFGSSGPFKVSSESPKKGSDHWSSV